MLGRCSAAVEGQAVEPELPEPSPEALEAMEAILEAGPVVAVDLRQVPVVLVELAQTEDVW